MNYDKNGYNKYGLSRDEQSRLDSINSSSPSSSRNIQEVRINQTGSVSHSVRSIFSIIIIIIIGFSLIRVINGGSPLTFSSFLDLLQNSPVINMPFRWFNDLTITSDWGLFNFLRDFINLNAGIVSVLACIAVGFINFFIYVFYFLRFIFV